jgi:hypothetical protein
VHRAFGIIGLAVALVWAGCGGGGGSTSAVGSPSGGGGTTNPGGSIVSPTVVTVGAGQTTQGVDITVPSGTPGLNAEVLGVASLSAGGGSADNTGASIARGSSGRVLIFGTGLSGSTQVSISGPQDISISNPQTIKATDGTPGVAFTIAVSATATPGARTVVLRDSKNNISTFTGGLEVR